MTRWETTQIPIYQVNKKGWKSHLKSSLCLLFFPFYGKEGHNKNMTYSEKGNESSKGHVGISGERVHTHCSKKSTRCRFKEYTRASSCSLIAILPATLSCKCYKMLGVWIHCFQVQWRWVEVEVSVMAVNSLAFGESCILINTAQLRQVLAGSCFKNNIEIKKSL